jgi:hypothetical protein
MNGLSKSKSPLPDLPLWLWVLLAPMILVSIPLIVWVGYFLSFLLKLCGASSETQEHSFEYSGILIVPVISLWILYVYAAYPRSNSPNRSNPSRLNTHVDVESLYRSQFSSEKERDEFEAWNQDRKDLYRDAPIGKTTVNDRF